VRHFKKLMSLLVFVLFAAAAIYKVASFPQFQLFGEFLYRVPTQEKVIALTFDDGPSPHNTPEVLALLKEFGVPATFFMIGQNIEKYPELASQVFQAGHQIASHSYSHQRTLLSSVEYFTQEIQRTDELIRKLGYQDEIVFRPPFGKKLINLPLALQRTGKLSVTWDAESEDTETQEPAKLKENILRHATAGSIILFHDGFARKEGTLTAVREILQTFRSQGYRFVTVNELRQFSDQGKAPQP
jgi:peptidoglycan-N-acetylglucosamine deacetylase